jgi:hypothetical protein
MFKRGVIKTLNEGKTVFKKISRATKNLSLIMKLKGSIVTNPKNDVV